MALSEEELAQSLQEWLNNNNDINQVLDSSLVAKVLRDGLKKSIL
jgi:hypothetical protein